MVDWDQKKTPNVLKYYSLYESETCTHAATYLCETAPQSWIYPSDICFCCDFSSKNCRLDTKFGKQLATVAVESHNVPSHLKP